MAADALFSFLRFVAACVALGVVLMLPLLIWGLTEAVR